MDIPEDIAVRIQRLRLRPTDLIILRTPTDSLTAAEYDFWHGIGETLNDVTGNLVVIVPDGADITAMPRELIEQLNQQLADMDEGASTEEEGE